ncbi:DUF1338 domain-containing protein [Alteromonas oceanisediminis]|uniref:DUF1338 domain-containing protein n=1 Tax=Alteromonas oceanisediminis TaxID=2836180 RepID=UPI001BDA93F4|nr:DUF1338 domain-containing protein [Alteromonas oceanisediminis]MBT0586110.1 DUF1338 domain-containing protein [Alteromonas oceanisediminis]
MHTSVESLFDALWQDYIAITPSAHSVHQLLATDDEDIINDHVAFRTFNHAKINLDKLAAHFLALGYEAKGDYDFESKKLTAKHFEHPNTQYPKVFISELRVHELSDTAIDIIDRLVASIDEDAATRTDFLYSGTHWRVSAEDYRILLSESEYAAWMAAWGFRANHFTVSVNQLQSGLSLAQVNQKLKDNGFKLNTSGGEIKGGEDVFLAQSSTMADRQRVEFSDETLEIPSCFYEFAQRYTLPNGKLYQGFVAASADKIFESTNAS